MKTLNKIYNVILERHMGRVKKFSYISPAICSTIQECLEEKLLTQAEVDKVTKHLYSQKPSETINPEFLVSSSYDKRPVVNNNIGKPNNYWWRDRGVNRNEVTTQRIMFLSKMIAITKEESVFSRIKNFITKK